jgi:CheY-like chemotaxis protein
MRILLVEDHDDTRRAMTTLLGLSAHEVIAVATAQEALEAVDGGGRFDCAVIDLGLPDAPGTQLMQELVTRAPIKGIALTGSTAPDDIQRCIDAGFAIHLPKPIAIEVLEAALIRLAPPT